MKTVEEISQDAWDNLKLDSKVYIIWAVTIIILIVVFSLLKIIVFCILIGFLIFILFTLLWIFTAEFETREEYLRPDIFMEKRFVEVTKPKELPLLFFIGGIIAIICILISPFFSEECLSKKVEQG
jgi:hypothetical protein